MEKKKAYPVYVADHTEPLPEPSPPSPSLLLPPLSEEEELNAMFKAKKKNKNKKDLLSSLAGGAPEDEAAPAPALSFGKEAEDKEIVDEPYEDMLSRIYLKLRENNPELLGNEKKKKKLPPPQVGRVGTTRTAWTNFKEICDGLNRAPDHVLSYFLSELGTTGVIDGSDRLLLKGKYLPKYIESLILKYVNDFVKCKNCNTVETEMRRDSETRLFFMDCRICGSSRSVGLIKAGFHATGKGERRKARDAAADP